MTEPQRLRRRRSASQHRKRPLKRAAEQWRNLLPLGAVGFTMIVFTLVGGAPLNILSILALTVSSAGLLAAIAFSPSASQLAKLPWQSWAALGAIVLLPLVQLVPIPPALWQALPGQDIRQTVLATIGYGNSWQPISLTPFFTLEAVIACLACVALILAMLLLDDRHLRHIGWLILAIVAVNVAIGTLQVASGGYPVLQESRNQGAMLGFFANKNHMGLFVAASMPLVWFLLDVRRRHSLGLYLFIGWSILSLVALVATNSRSGLVVGMIAAGALSLQLLSRQSVRLRLVSTVGAAVAIAIFSATNPFDMLFNRFSEVNDDVRWQFWQQSIPLLKTYWLFGSGAGSFAQIFIVNERLSWLQPTYVNAVHNDYIQLFIEFGVPGIAVLFLVVAALVHAAWHDPIFIKTSTIAKGARAGIIIIILFAIQSLVDYPLRRVATLPMFAIAIVLIMRVALSHAANQAAVEPK